MTRCIFVAVDQPRMLPDGEPCHETHCIMPWCPGRHVTSGDICPVCVGETRNELAQIEAMSGRLLTEAMHQGVNSAAAALAGPAADPDVFGRRLALAIDNRLCECEPPSDDVMHPLACPFAAAYIEDAADEPHPLYVTGTWDLLVTEHLGHERTQRVTLSGAVSYLGANLTDLAADPTFPFEEMARDLRKCRSHLEDALCDGIRSETGAPCMACRKPLVRVWGATEAQDGWKCHECAETRSDREYALNVAQQLDDAEDERWANGAPEWATADEIGRRLGVKPSALSMRAKRGALRSRLDAGRTVYRVEDLPARTTERIEGAS